MQISHKYKDTYHIFDIDKKDIKEKKEKKYISTGTGEFKSVKETLNEPSILKMVYLREEILYKIFYVICPICDKEIIIKEKRGKRLKIEKVF